MQHGKPLQHESDAERRSGDAGDYAGEAMQKCKTEAGDENECGNARHPQIMRNVWPRIGQAMRELHHAAAEPKIGREHQSQHAARGRRHGFDDEPR